jgi:hypothetical protein
MEHGAASKRDYEFILTVIYTTMILSLIFLIFTIVCRNTNVIKLSQPTFLALLPVGGIAMALSLYNFLGMPNETQCVLRFGLLNVCFTFTFSCFLWKVHRAWKVAKAVRYMKKIKFTNADVYIYIFSVTGVDVVFTLLSAAVWPNRPEYAFVPSEFGSTHHLLTENYNCYSDSNILTTFGDPFMFLSCLLKVFLIGFGCLLCYRTKSFSGNYAESTALLFTIYTIAISALVLLFSGFVEKRMQLKIYSGAVVFNTCFPLMFMFLPRIIRLGVHGDITHAELMERTQKMRLKAGAAKKFASGASSTLELKRTSQFQKFSDKRPSASPARPSASQRASGYGGAISQAFNSKSKSSTPTGPKRASVARRRGSSVFSMNNVAMSSDPDEMLESILKNRKGGVEDGRGEKGNDEVHNKVQFSATAAAAATAEKNIELEADTQI